MFVGVGIGGVGVGIFSVILNSSGIIVVKRRFPEKIDLSSSVSKDQWTVPDGKTN